MKIKIEEDLFDVVSRIKEIDDGYFVLFDDVKGMYEIHNINQQDTYCLTYPYNGFDSRAVDIVLYSNINNIDNIVGDIDNNNKYIENNANSKLSDQSRFMLSEIYKYASNSSKSFNNNSAFKNIWR